MPIESNITQFISAQKDMLSELGLNSDKILRQASFDLVALITDRIQQRGELTSGEKMKTSSPYKAGAYSFDYAKYTRAKTGRQINHIDLTLTGEMMDNFLPTANGDNEYVIGFLGKSNADKAEWNELNFGVIFEASNEEISQTGESIADNVNEIIRRNSI